jgi:asparagine synthetase B (glutamine-hydrolysing)
LLELKIPFDCHTYYFKAGKDVSVAQELAMRYHIHHTIYEITPEQVKESLIKLRADGYKGKVLLDCLVGHKPIAENLKDAVVINGSFADALFGNYFWIQRAVYKTKSKAIFDEQRRKSLFKKDADGTESLTKLFAKNNNEVFYPFAFPELIEEFFKYDNESLNKPRIKEKFYEDFKPYIEGLKIKRRSQQIESGLRDYIRDNKL